ncbi:MAG: DUF3789 domain-containing protein [Clostridia bacterium]|nr:DUF3789 domain-containing protein [Clostridia bacterium]
MFIFLLGLLTGGVLGVFFMCLMQVGREQ